VKKIRNVTLITAFELQTNTLFIYCSHTTTFNTIILQKMLQSYDHIL